MEQIASNENKGDARNETNGRRGREERTERANEKYLPKHILLHFRTVFMFILYGDLPVSLPSCVCYERKQTLRGLVRFWLSSIAGEHARSPSPPIACPVAPTLASLLRPT